MISRRKLLKVAAPALLIGRSMINEAAAMQLSPWSPYAYAGDRLAAGYDTRHVAFSAGGMGANGVTCSLIPQGNNMQNLLTGTMGIVHSNVSAKTIPILGPCCDASNGWINAPTFSPNGNLSTVAMAMFFQVAALSISGSQIGTFQSTTSSNGGFSFQIVTGPILQFWGNTSTISVPISLNVPYFVLYSNLGHFSSQWVILVNLLTGQKTVINTGNGVQNNGPGVFTWGGGVFPGASSGGVTVLWGPCAYILNFLSLAAGLVWADAPWDFWYPSNQLDAELVGGVNRGGGGALLLQGVGN